MVMLFPSGNSLDAMATFFATECEALAFFRITAPAACWIFAFHRVV
jgi:hypothetical protein